MNRSVALIAVAALVLLGVLGGMIGVHLFYARQLEERGLGHRHEPRAFRNEMAERLGLTPEQREQLEQVMRESHAEADALRREFRPRVEEHMRRTRERIGAILTPEQQAEFERFHRRHPHRAERFLLGPPPRGRGPHGPGHGPPAVD